MTLQGTSRGIGSHEAELCGAAACAHGFPQRESWGLAKTCPPWASWARSEAASGMRGRKHAVPFSRRSCPRESLGIWAPGSSVVVSRDSSFPL